MKQSLATMKNYKSSVQMRCLLEYFENNWMFFSSRTVSGNVRKRPSLDDMFPEMASSIGQQQ